MVKWSKILYNGAILVSDIGVSCGRRWYGAKQLPDPGLIETSGETTRSVYETILAHNEHVNADNFSMEFLSCLKEQRILFKCVDDLPISDRAKIISKIVEVNMVKKPLHY